MSLRRSIPNVCAILTIAIASWLSAEAIAQSPPGPTPTGPVAKIVAPTEAEPGDLIILDASTSDGAGYAWTVVPAGKSFLPVDGGSRCVFASGKAGEFTFVLAVAKGDKACIARHTIRIGKGPGPEPPGPVPPVPPEPAELSRKVAGWARELVPTDKLTLPAKRLAAVYRIVADQIKDGVHHETRQVIDATRILNDQVLGEDKTAWERFRVKLGEQMDAMETSGKLKDPASWEQCWRQIAAGLEGA